MINNLNDIAANDNLRYATEELDRSRAEVIRARRDMTLFRNQYQIVDPESEIVAQSSILASLQQQLAENLINLDLLRDGSSAADPRIPPLENRIRVIEERIMAEKAKIGSDAGGEVFADVLAEYERLAAERLFAENAYQAARAAYETSLAENRRQSRYLAAHVLPTLAESSEYPKRMTRLVLIAGFLSMVWAISALIVYSLRDRR
jgi:capsular polysaccharide transport system permease protein